MIARVFATLLLVPLLAATVARPDETRRIDTVLTYGPGTELVQHSAPTLSDVAQAAWDTEFRPMPYFAAFALAKSGGFGYATTANSRAAARAIAMSECLSLNDQCRIIAEILPGGYADPAGNAATLSNEVAGYYADLATRPAFKAGAISADGAYSFVWGHPSQDAADAAALDDCDGYRRKPATPDAPSWPCVLLPNPEAL